jgi:Protein of unknown function (DUF1552)
MRRRILHRRTILKGAAHGLLAAVALPPLEAMLNGNGTAYAADGVPIPVRFGVWYWGSGVRKAQFFPTLTGPNWESTPELEPLQSVRSELNVLGGFAIREGGIVHHIGTAVLKTGRTYVDYGGNFNTDVTTHSFDVDVARHLGAATAFPALHVGVFSDGVFKGEGLNTRALSHNGMGSPNMAETSPQAVFDRLFTMPATAPTPGARPFPSAAHRKSVLDLVSAQARSLRQRLGAADQARIDEHLDAIRGIELRLAAMPPTTTTACQPPARPSQGSPPIRDPDMVLHNEVMVDLTAMALACDLTRVFTFRHHGWTDDPVFSDLGATDSHHNLTHNEGGNQPVVHAITVFTMGQLAKLIERLRSVTIGAGTLLDHAAIMAYSEVGEGQSHSLDDIPILTIGRAGGALRTGLYHRSTSRESATMINLTMMRAVGMQVESFGEGPSRVTESVSAIMA